FSSRRRHTRFSRDWSSDVCSSDLIDVGDLPRKIVEHQSTRLELSISSPAEMLTLDEMQHRYVRQVLAAVGGNKTQAAQILGIDRSEERRGGEECSSAGRPKL